MCQPIGVLSPNAARRVLCCRALNARHTSAVCRSPVTPQRGAAARRRPHPAPHSIGARTGHPGVAVLPVGARFRRRPMATTFCRFGLCAETPARSTTRALQPQQAQKDQRLNQFPSTQGSRVAFWCGERAPHFGVLSSSALLPHPNALAPPPALLRSQPARISSHLRSVPKQLSSVQRPPHRKTAARASFFAADLRSSLPCARVHATLVERAFHIDQA